MKRYLERLNPLQAYRILRRRSRARRRRARVLRVATLEAAGEPRGDVLLSYISDPLFLGPDASVSNAHTHDWETLQMARTWRDLGYRVDVIHWLNDEFVPTKAYDWFIDVRLNLERLSGTLNRDCVKVMHIETAHWLSHATAQYRRLLDLQQRRGLTLPPRRLVEENYAIEHADCATILGDGYARETYAYAGRPLRSVPISSQAQYEFPEDKDFGRCRRNFLWFGSDGFVHKGLDLVLEAFSEMPEFRLTVCGPIHTKGKDFRRAFHRELFETPNIETVGWVDVESPKFERIARENLGLVYPSCSEGQNGGTVLCMHAGLIPIVSRETGVPVKPSFGLQLEECSIASIKEAVRELAEREACELREMARAAWEFARANHTRENFARRYRHAVEELIAAYGINRRERTGELAAEVPA